jgi:hypothetical protein
MKDDGVTRTAHETETLMNGFTPIALIPVSSSQIASVGYDSATAELVIKFHASEGRQQAVYLYEGVPPELAYGLIAASSPGSFFHRYIRNGPYRYRRLEGSDLPQQVSRACESEP